MTTPDRDEIAEIKAAMDEAQARYLLMLKRRKDASDAQAASSAAIGKAGSTRDAAISKAQTTFDAARNKALDQYNSVVTSEEQKVSVARSAAEEAHRSLVEYQTEVSDRLGIVIDMLASQQRGGGQVRL